jgi:hypothetical protein
MSTFELTVFGHCYWVHVENGKFRVTSEQGESHVLSWDGIKLVGPSYALVPSEFRAHLAQALRARGLIN